jgi:hypothetical protein
MKNTICILALLTIMRQPVFGQKTQDSTSHQWSINSDNYFYFIPNDFFFLPVLRGDNGKLHVEARYNYESLQTFSGWLGYNFNGGSKVEYAITPMIGLAIGDTRGIAPGLEATVDYKKFELYSEAEYLFDLNEGSDSYFYNWTDLTFSPKDWLWFGISGQRTRVYQTSLDIQRGITVGGGSDRWELNGYLFNIGTEDLLGIAGLSFHF